MWSRVFLLLAAVACVTPAVAKDLVVTDNSNAAILPGTLRYIISLEGGLSNLSAPLAHVFPPAGVSVDESKGTLQVSGGLHLALGRPAPNTILWGRLEGQVIFPEFNGTSGPNFGDERLTTTIGAISAIQPGFSVQFLRGAFPYDICIYGVIGPAWANVKDDFAGLAIETNNKSGWSGRIGEIGRASCRERV